MTAYVGRRLGQALLTLFAVSVVLFLLMKLFPGDPGWILQGRGATQATAAEIDAMLGLNLPWPVQYLKWLQQLVAGGFSGVLGTLPPTLLMVALGGGLGLLLAVLLASVQARRKGRLVDDVLTIASLVVYALPCFFVALLLWEIFGLNLGWVPLVPAGMPPGAQTFGGWLLAMIIPTVAIAFTVISSWSMHLRAAFEEAMHADFVRTARAKGLPERLVHRRHVLRSGLLPLLAIIGLTLPALLTNVIVLQIWFSSWSIGQLLIGALQERANGILMDGVLVVGVVVVLVNLVVDVLAAFSDPRVRFQ